MPPIARALVSVIRSLRPNVVCIASFKWSYSIKLVILKLITGEATCVCPDFSESVFSCIFCDCWKSGLYLAVEFEFFPIRDKLLFSTLHFLAEKSG